MELTSLQPLPLADFKLTDSFWSGWIKNLAEKGLMQQWTQIVETKRLANFYRVMGKEEGTHEGYIFNDSDIYKWLEACGFVLAHQSLSKEIHAAIDIAIDAIKATQMEDGYINTFFQLKHPELRWRNLTFMHEMYCAGHLIEAAVTFSQATQGKDNRLLDIAIKFADHIVNRFGDGTTPGIPGHEEVELALIRLANLTKEEKYRQMAKRFIDSRGQRPSPYEKEFLDEEVIKLSPYFEKMMFKDGNYVGEYNQDHLPIREHNDVVGHAVRAMYLYVAAAEQAKTDADEPLATALERAWSNLVERRMYITGGIGPSGDNEGFTFDYDLPNRSAYAETCAAVGLVFWGRRMLELTGNSEYADVMEKALYNGAISGISLDTEKTFYTNPLESYSDHERTPWHGCACCPPNIARLIGGVGQYATSTSSDALWVHIPMAMEGHCVLNGCKVKFTITMAKGEAPYPYGGRYTITLRPEKMATFGVRIRVPDWVDSAEADVANYDEEADYENGYIVINRTWHGEETISVDLTMEAKWMASHPKILDNAGRVCLTRGPLVYCAESVDLGIPPQLISVDTMAEVIEESVKDSVLGDFTALTTTIHALMPDEQSALYIEPTDLSVEQRESRFIPYFMWNNRGLSHMQVWVRSQF